jgi:Predicted nucleotidyltransferases
VTPAIEISNERIAEFCTRHRIRQLALFGSVLRPDFGPESDVDVLVEFDLGTAEASSNLRGSSESSLLSWEVEGSTFAPLRT